MDEYTRRKPSSSSSPIDEHARRKPISSSSSIDEHARRKPISPSSIDEYPRRKPISSSSMDEYTRRIPIPPPISSAAGVITVSSRQGKALAKTSGTDQKATQTYRENLQVRSRTSVAATGANVDDYKLQITETSHQYVRKSSLDQADVDKSADDFINKFRKNLKIERKESLDSYKDMLDRGA